MSTDFDNYTIRLKADSHAITKNDEIEVIINLHEFFANKGLYLTDLFTNRLAEWTANKIRSDVCPDVYAEWMHSKDDANHYKDVVNDCHSQIHDINIKVKDYEVTNRELYLTIGERDASIETYARQIKDLEDIVTDLSEGVITYQEEAEEHVNEINKLKAQLWDLTKEQLIREWGTGGV